MRNLLAISLALCVTLAASCGGDNTADDTSPDVNSPSDSGTDTGPDTVTEADAGDQAPAGCRSDEECLADDGSYIGMYCGTPFDDNVCGRPPVMDCGSHEGCPGEMLCHHYVDDCSPGGVGRRCEASCIDHPELCSENGGDLVCDADGACVGLSCLDGYGCHAVQLCDPEAEEADVHGCNFVACQADGDCAPGLFCVLSQCLDALGVCTEHSMVP